jgi:hypothetical protein
MKGETTAGPEHPAAERRRCVSARTRLNRAFFNGSLLVAGVIGVASGSFGVFAVSFAGLLAANVVFREIRLPWNRPR